jgi:membrane protease YdiL (CAAX protease family)
MPSKVKDQSVSAWLMLLSRSLLFLFFQALFALGLVLAGRFTSWQDSAGWWPLGVFLANVIGVVLLIRLFKNEGANYRDIFKFHKETIKSDLLALLLIFPVIGALGFFPNLLLGRWLFGDSLIALRMFIQPLPLWATIIAVVLFPVSQGFAELPIYFAYVMPRIEKQTSTGWLAVGLTGLFLSIQHAFAPLVFDYRFILWRGLMFLPFALAVGFLVRWRPRLLPYLVIVHILMDFSLAPYFLGA